MAPGSPAIKNVTAGGCTEHDTAARNCTARLAGARVSAPAQVNSAAATAERIRNTIITGVAAWRVAPGLLPFLCSLRFACPPRRLFDRLK